MYECFICSPAAAALELFLPVVAGHPFKAWISAVVQNKDGEAEGHRRCDERMCWESLVEGEREEALPVWRGSAALAPCPHWHRAHQEAVCGRPWLHTEPDGGRCVGSLHICMSGRVLTQQESGRGGWGGGNNQRCYCHTWKEPAVKLLPRSAPSVPLI